MSKSSRSLGEIIARFDWNLSTRSTLLWGGVALILTQATWLLLEFKLGLTDLFPNPYFIFYIPTELVAQKIAGWVAWSVLIVLTLILLNQPSVRPTKSIRPATVAFISIFLPISAVGFLYGRLAHTDPRTLGFQISFTIISTGAILLAAWRTRRLIVGP